MIIFELVTQIGDKFVIMFRHAGNQFISGEKVIEISCTNERRSKTIIPIDIHCTETEFKFFHPLFNFNLLLGDGIFHLKNIHIEVENGLLDGFEFCFQNLHIILQGIDFFSQSFLISLFIFLVFAEFG